MDMKKLVKKLQTDKIVKKFGFIVLLACMTVLFASSIIQPAFSCFTFEFSRTVGGFTIIIPASPSTSSSTRRTWASLAPGEA